MIIENNEFQQKSYKNLLPKPKTHLFMKRFTRIQAIDRQMRKNWIKMKLQNEQKKILSEQKYFCSIKVHRQHNPVNQSNQQLIRSRLQDDSQKRLKILSNHKKNQDIFYGKKRIKTVNKNQYLSQQKLFKQISQHNSRISPFKQVQNQSGLLRLKHIKSCSSQLQAHKNYRQNRIKTENKQSPKKWSEHLMIRKRIRTKQKQLQIMNFQSSKEIQRINKKVESQQKKRLDLQKSLLKKMQKSKIYYELIKPIHFEDYQN